jgi:hypothetical protein
MDPVTIVRIDPKVRSLDDDRVKPQRRENLAPHDCASRGGNTMKALALMLKPISRGWAVTLTDGRELVRFTGFGAKRRALRYLITHDLGREASHAY